MGSGSSIQNEYNNNRTYSHHMNDKDYEGYISRQNVIEASQLETFLECEENFFDFRRFITDIYDNNDNDNSRSDDSRSSSSVSHYYSYALYFLEFWADIHDYVRIPSNQISHGNGNGSSNNNNNYNCLPSPFQIYRARYIFESYLMHGSVKYLPVSVSVRDSICDTVYSYSVDDTLNMNMNLNMNNNYNYHDKSDGNCYHDGNIESVVSNDKRESSSINKNNDIGPVKTANIVTLTPAGHDGPNTNSNSNGLNWSLLFSPAVAEALDFLVAEVYPSFDRYQYMNKIKSSNGDIGSSNGCGDVDGNGNNTTTSTGTSLNISTNNNVDIVRRKSNVASSPTSKNGANTSNGSNNNNNNNKGNNNGRRYSGFGNMFERRGSQRDKTYLQSIMTRILSGKLTMDIFVYLDHFHHHFVQ